MTITTFALSSMYWIIFIVYTFLVIDVWRSQFDTVPHKPPDWMQITVALPILNVSVHYKSRSHISENP
jgi:hypothetical protein